MLADAVQLRSDIRSCTACPLHNHAKAPVPWAGPTPSKYLFIGMAPGVQEDRAGVPFIGSSGNSLKFWLREAGFPPDVAFANAVSCFPGRVKGGDAKPTPAQLDACRPLLLRQIDIVQPSYIFLVGGTALETFRPDLTLSYTHGRPLYYDGTDFEHDIPRPIRMWTIYHPAAAIRNKKYEVAIKDDLAAFWQWRRAGEDWPEFCYICTKDVHFYDHWGFPTCELHSHKQRKLFQ